jgi:tryptophan synthase alpha chain
MNLSRAFDVVAGARADGVKAPLIMMSYINTILQAGGVDSFASRAWAAGVDGVIVPDYPLGGGLALTEALDRNGLASINLVTPNTPDDRIAEIAGSSSGFLYLVSVTGTTGQRDDLPSRIDRFVERVRARTDLPIALGFGISKPEQVAEARQLVDGVIFGSALVSRIADRDQARERARVFVRDMAEAA